MSSYHRSFSLVRSPIATRFTVAILVGLGSGALPALAAEEIGEIVVTVRQRAESVQDVPGSVNVLSQEAIEASGIERARDFIALTPGVTIVNAAEVADSQVNIRGMNGARDAETNYGLIIDGILMTNPAALNREYLNLKQIEVLKGPQGAIYGRNAAAGAFVITTEKPGDVFGGNVKASYGEDATYLVSGNMGGPAGDTFNWSMGGHFQDSNGYYSNKNTGSAYPPALYTSDCDDCVDNFSDWSVDGRLIWEPSDVLSVDTKLRYGQVDAGSISFNSSFQLPGPVAFGAPPTFYEDVNKHDFGFNPNVLPFNSQRSTEISSKVDYDLGWADMTAWGLYSDIYNSLGADGTSGAFGFFAFEPRCQDTTAALQDFPVNSPQVIGPTPLTSLYGAYTPTSCDGTQYQQRHQKDYSFEVRLASKDDERLRWLGGLYYLNIDRSVGVNLGLDGGLDPTNTLSSGVILQTLYTTDPKNPTQQLVSDRFTTDVYSVFGQLAYDITDTIEGSLALRYDREDREVHNRVPTPADGALTVYIDTCLDDPSLGGADPTPGLDPINPGLCATGSIPDKSKDFDHFSPKLAFTWDATDYLTAYTSVGVGFRSGGFNSQGSQATVNSFINDLVVIPNAADYDPLTPPVATNCTEAAALGTPCVQINDDYKEETSVAWEIGAKGTAPGGRLRGEIAYYYTDVDDMQFFEFFVGPFGLLRVVSNIDSVHIQGVEASVDYIATDWLELYGGANWTGSEIKKNNSRPDTEGNDSPFTPDYTASFGGRMTFPVTEDMNFIYNMDFRMVGDTWFHTIQDQERPTLFTNLPYGLGPGQYDVTQRDAYTIVNARMGLEGDSWSVVAFANNLFDTEYLEEVITAPEFGGSFIHPGSQSRFGMEASYRF